MTDEVQCKEKETIALSLGEIENPTINEMIETAEAFFEAASCYDHLGDRKSSAKNFTLAGEFYMAIDERDRAAECYGKAILRNLMADELESARVLLDKGKDYGEHFDTFHFRLATDSFSRRITDEFNSLYDEAYYGFIDETDEKEEIQLFDDVPTSSLLEQGELEKILIEDKETIFETKSEDISKVSLGMTKGYKISSTIDTDKRGRIIDTLISSVKQKERVNIISNMKAKSLTGNSIKITQKRDINVSEELLENINLLSDDISTSEDTLENIDISDITLFPSNFQENETIVKSSDKPIKDDKLSTKNLTSYPLETSEENIDQLGLQSSLGIEEGSEVNDLLTQVSDFVSLSEIENPADEDLENLEIKDIIPLNWQIKGIKASKDMVLLSQEIDSETGSLIFKWKRNSLRSGEKAKIKYYLSKRIQRTIISVIKDQILVQILYYDIEKSGKVGLVADIPYQHLSESKIDFLLIEDVIPPELKVTGVIPTDLAFLQYHTREGLLFRWVMTSIPPTFPLNIQYQLIERPLSISLKHNFQFKEHPNSLLTLHKIVEPMIDVLSHEYLIYYELTAKNLPECVIDIQDSLYPKNINVQLIATSPTWMRPVIRTKDGEHKIYKWDNIEINSNKTRRFIVRVKTDQPLKSVDPVVTIKKSDVYGFSTKCQINEEVTITENIDLRKKMGMSRLIQE